MAKDLRAFTLGLLVFAGLTLAYLALKSRGTEQSLLLGWLATAIIYSAPVFAGIACTMLAPSRPVATLVALGIVAAALFGALNFAWGGRHLNLGPLSNVGWIVVVSLVVMPLLVIAGGVLGAYLRESLGGSTR